MMTTLDDAWNWYESVKSLTQTMDRLGKKFWETLPWDDDLGRDERLKELEASDIVDMSATVLRDLDDLCVLLLFSVFEAIVRDLVIRDVDAELPAFKHVALKRAIVEMKEDIEQGSFFKVLDPYKEVDANLVEEVNQVRRYRNWVAHGRRSAQPPVVDPRSAYDRLQRFLDNLNSS